MIKVIVRSICLTIVALAVLSLNSCATEIPDDFEEYDIDTDGDGIFDSQELVDGTNRNDPCDPPHSSGYIDYNASNLLWRAADCDGDGLVNGDELSASSDPYGDPNFAIPEFLPNLSQLKLFKGDLANFEYSDNVYEYGMSTALFTDYAHKLRVVAIPVGEQLTYQGGGLLDFPDDTILAKTFYYLNDERDASKGKKIIETRVLIKKQGAWLVRNYYWNEEQTDATLDDDSHALQIDWVDETGASKSVDYVVPSNDLCVQCHNIDDVVLPIGPKARVMNFEHKGQNVLEYFKDNNLMAGAPDISEIPKLPDWSDASLPLEERARAYLDVNCAHCHQTGGSYNATFGDTFQFTYETPFEDSNIYGERTQIRDRMNTQIPGYFMPLIGTSLKHDEGIALMNAYIDSLD